MKIDIETINYKPLTIDSIPRLLEFQEEAFDHAKGVNPDFLRRNTYETLAVCFQEPSLVLGAYYKDELIAFGILYAAGKSEENLAKDIDGVADISCNANIKLVIVRPDYRGNGLQAMIITKLEEYALKQGFVWLSSTVSPVNIWSMTNFQRCGFTAYKMLKKYGGLERILFAKKLR